MRSEAGINWCEITWISGQQDGFVTSYRLCEYNIVYYFVLKYNNILILIVLINICRKSVVLLAKTCDQTYSGQRFDPIYGFAFNVIVAAVDGLAPICGTCMIVLQSKIL